MRSYREDGNVDLSQDFLKGLNWQSIANNDWYGVNTKFALVDRDYHQVYNDTPTIPYRMLIRTRKNYTPAVEYVKYNCGEDIVYSIKLTDLLKVINLYESDKIFRNL